LDGETSAMSNGTSMPSKSLRRASETDTLTMLPSGTTPSPSTGGPGLDSWMSSGWTALEPLETVRFREWLEKHGADYEASNDES
jgi:hypothetical protein